MKINTALILCAGLGKRLNPITLETPKPLLKLNDIPILETCIDTIIKSGFKKILINTFHLREQICNFIKLREFKIDIQIIDDGNKILNTGGGILNLIENSQDQDFIIFNPDTVWSQNYVDEIDKMQNFYFSNRLNNILLLANRDLSFDKKLKGDFNLTNNLVNKSQDNKYIYIGCQILNRSLFETRKIENFSITETWDELLKKKKLNGFESFNSFYHLTNLEIFKKLKDL